MIKGKTRHQLFLPLETSRRLAAMAKSQKRSRSNVLAEILETQLNRRSAVEADDRIFTKLDEIDRLLERINSETVIISHSLSRFIRHELIYAAALPPPDKDAKALGEKRYLAFLDSIARFIAREPGNQEESAEGPNGDTEGRVH
jgi:hypothetical protein